MSPMTVVDDYFAALARRDVEAMAELWAPDGDEHIAGQVDAVGPGGVREYFTDFFAAYPDFAVEVQSVVAEGERAAVHWTASGTQLGSPSSSTSTRCTRNSFVTSPPSRSSTTLPVRDRMFSDTNRSWLPS
jgi:uncharacterized protein (TIGR02246 family)